MSTDIRREALLDLENAFWQAMKDQNVEAAVNLTDFPCVVAGASGAASVDRDTFEQMMTSGSWTLEDFEIGDGATVRFLSDDVAITAYSVREDVTVDGQPVTFEAADTSVWIRRDGTWRCALHTESLAGDSFGRDRVQPD